MIGVLVTLAFCLASLGGGRWLVRRLDPSLDPALAFGLGGLLSLGFVGLGSLFVLYAPGGTSWGMAVPILAALAGLAGWRFGGPLAVRKPSGFDWAFVLGLTVVGLLGLIGTLAPSTAMDWDSLAYHLAVPKLWIQAGHAYSVSFIHHSNFPFAFDNLFVWGLQWGGESGAKAFVLVSFAYGCAALFGLGRTLYSEKAGWWGALAFAGMPVVAWESGTAYVDIAHGLYAGLGLVFAAMLASGAKSPGPWITAFCLGLAMGTKYTGLQTLLVVGLLFVVALAVGRGRSPVRPFAITVVVALIVGAPWYARNQLLVGNPVFPFFYEQLGGKNWDQFAADIYREEQQTFGVGRRETGGRDFSQFAHGVFGLAYQPGRFTNPSPTTGAGFPTQALGMAVFGGLVLWSASGRMKRFEGTLVGGLLLSFALWFVLSQQSRYAINFGVPMAALVGGAVASLRAGPVLAAFVALQAFYTVYLTRTLVTDGQVKTALGLQSREAMVAKGPFYTPAKLLNELAAGGKVALFDEVFGYFLDVPYFWANPGHSTEIPYPELKTGAEFVEALKAMGFTHVYLNLQYQEKGFRARWFEAMNRGGRPFEGEERAALFADRRTQWKALLADAVASGRFVPIRQGNEWLIFQIQ
ncbi:MAG: hypothetical protein KIS66_15015 [Fimbriimonadaceae bacterium]|nr:hypothetical protein [Fimbriimonadaceae bacterium]